MATNEKEKPVSTIRSLNGKSINPNYLLTLSNGDNSVKIEVPIPKDFGLRSEVDWGNLSKDLLPGSFGSVIDNIFKGLDLTSKITGAQSSTVNAIQQFPIWLSNSPISFDIPFEFRAMSDAKKEVVEPIKQLLGLACPMEEGDLLYAPGPRIKINSNNTFSFDPKYNIKLKIGNLMTIRNILITNVNPTFDSRFVASGSPISAKAEVSFRTLKAPTYQDLMSWFEGEKSSDPLQDLVNKANKLAFTKTGAKTLSKISNTLKKGIGGMFG